MQGENVNKLALEPGQGLCVFKKLQIYQMCKDGNKEMWNLACGGQQVFDIQVFSATAKQVSMPEFLPTLVNMTTLKKNENMISLIFR